MAVAEQLAASGVHLVLVARGRERLESVAHELTGRHGIEVEVIAADLGDRASLRAVEDRLRAGPPIDLLVNNAAVTTFGAFASADIDAELAQVEVNVIAPLRLAHAALPAMRRQGRGAIVMVSSLDALLPMPHHATYAGTKAFLNHVSEALDAELAGSGVSVTTVLPGFVRTDMTRTAGLTADAVSRVPAPLLLEPDQVAREAIEAAASGRSLVVPGRVYTLWATIVRLLPRPARRRIARVILPPETRSLRTGR